MEQWWSGESTQARARSQASAVTQHNRPEQSSVGADRAPLMLFPFLCHSNDASWEPWCVAWNGITQNRTHKHLFRLLSGLVNGISRANWRGAVAWLTSKKSISMQAKIHPHAHHTGKFKQGVFKPKWLEHRGWIHGASIATVQLGWENPGLGVLTRS